MSLYDYRKSQEIEKQDYPFYALLMAAMRKADDFNLVALKGAFPCLYDELRKRYNAPGGFLEDLEEEKNRCDLCQEELSMCSCYERGKSGGF